MRQAKLQLFHIVLQNLLEVTSASSANAAQRHAGQPLGQRDAEVSEDPVGGVVRHGIGQCLEHHLGDDRRRCPDRERDQRGTIRFVAQEEFGRHEVDDQIRRQPQQCSDDGQDRTGDQGTPASANRVGDALLPACLHVIRHGTPLRSPGWTDNLRFALPNHIT